MDPVAVRYGVVTELIRVAARNDIQQPELLIAKAATLCEYIHGKTEGAPSKTLHLKK